MAMSPLELRHIIESGFLPLHCRCFINARNELTIELIDPATAQNLITSGISVAQLNSSRAIANLIAELKTRLLNSTETAVRSTA